MLDKEQRDRLDAALDKAGLSDDAKAFIHLRTEGMSLRALAPVFNRSATTLGRIERRLLDRDGMALDYTCQGLDGKTRPARRYDTRDRDERIRALGATGRSVRAIAAEVGCSVGTVHRVLNRGRD